MRTAPGFCTLRAFTTWNTSTTPSVLQRSMVVAMAQNMPLRLTVSLQGRHSLTHTSTHSHPPHVHSSPAVYHNGTVASPPLDFAHFINHVSHSLQARAAAIRGPVGDVELAHLLGTARLQGRSHQPSHI